MSDNDGASRLDRLEELIDQRTEQIIRLVAHGEKVNDFLSKIADAHVKLAENQNRLELAQTETTEKLNALIAVVDDLVKARGGQQPL
jgi:hypothetical protein